MSNLSNKILTVLTWVLMAITIVFALIFYFGNLVPGTEGTRLEEPTITQTFLVWAYVLFGITAGLTIIFSLINFVINPKGAKKSIIAIVAAAALIVIAYLMADDTVLDLPFYSGTGNEPATLKFVDTTLFTAYGLVIIAFLSILWSSISKAFK